MLREHGPSTRDCESRPRSTALHPTTSAATATAEPPELAGTPNIRTRPHDEGDPHPTHPAARLARAKHEGEQDLADEASKAAPSDVAREELLSALGGAQQ